MAKNGVVSHQIPSNPGMLYIKVPQMLISALGEMGCPREIGYVEHVTWNRAAMLSSIFI